MTAKTLVPATKNRYLFWAIFIFAFLLYANSIRNGFSIDDRHVTVTTPEHPDNPRVARGLRGIPEIFSTRYIQDDVGNFEYRPIPLATFAIEYQFFGSNAHMNHFFNVLIYACTAVLLFLVLGRLLAGYSVVLPLLATLLFVVHPVHTEVVNNIKSRDELLSFFFGMLSLYFFLDMHRHAKKWVPVAKMVFFLLLALLCKKSAALFIVMIALSAIFFRQANTKKIIFLVGGMLFGYFLYAIFTRIMLHDAAPVSRQYTFYENPLYFEHGIGGRVSMALFTTGYYARLLFVPYPLCFYYGYNAVPVEGMGFLWMGVSLIFHGWLLYYAIKRIRRKEIVSFFILVYLAGFAPFANLGLPAVGILAERFIYFSSMGFCLLAAYFLMKYTGQDLASGKQDTKHIRPALKRISVFILLVFSVMVVARNTSWKDLATLSLNDVKHFEHSYQVQAFAANALQAQAVTSPQQSKRQLYAREARVHFVAAAAILREGLETHPQDYISRNTLGNIYTDFLREPDLAMPLYKEVLREHPQFEPARLGLVHCYELKSKFDTAIVMYQSMQRDGMNDKKVFLGLHDLYMKKENYAAALATDQQAVERYPHDVQLILATGNAYMNLNDTLNGLLWFEKAVAETPDDAGLLQQVARVYELAGRPGRAREYERKARQAMNK